jgi:8-oxo-dGTP pyrophosphatase MutT (NUDIX family)
MLPGAEHLRAALEDLSASEHKDWKPHVTLAYVEPGEPLPDPVPATPVTFTHLSVHRGHDEVARFPFGRVPGTAKSAAEDESRAGFLMLRARHPDDGKWRYLLQKRPDGGWGLPGGTTHAGEHPHAAAIRESTEEIGDLPPLGAPKAVAQYPGDGKTFTVHLHDVPFFQPRNNGSTPEETAGTGWFKRREVGDLDLHPPFRRQWESADWHGIGKSLSRRVDEQGEVINLAPASQRLQAVGSRWPYPHRADGAEWPDAGPGAVPGASAGGEPPHWDDNGAEPEPHDTLEPAGDDGKMPARGRKPNPAATAFPDQGGEHDDMWPEPQATLQPSGSSVGARTGVPPSGEKRAKVSRESVNYRAGTRSRRCGTCSMYSGGTYSSGSCTLVVGQIDPDDVCDRWEAEPAEKNDAGHPVVGSVPAKTPQPYKPHSVEPEAFDPAETVEDWSPEAESNVVHNLPKGAGGPGDYRDANPVDAEHILSIMRAQFPEKALGWVRRAAWTGPVLVPWERIDHDDQEKWAAAHQPAKVRQFARDIKAGKRTNPSILFQPPGDGKVIVADGHHRAVARHSMGQDVLAYVAHIRPGDREAAEQTHSFQFHSGSDPANKGHGQTSAEVLRQYWTHEGHPGPTQYALEEKIRWGDGGDWQRCVDQLTPYVGGEGAKGYCNLRHHEVLGYWPAQHAQMERGE